MKWTSTPEKNKINQTCNGFKIIPCAQGRCQLREVGRMRGSFTSEAAAKAHAEFLLAQRKPEKPQKTAEPKADGKRPRHPKILGHSVCAVARALGQAGLKYPEADAVMKAQGVTMPPASLRVQLGFGRSEKTWVRHGHPAEITKEQINQLRKLAAAKESKS